MYKFDFGKLYVKRDNPKLKCLLLFSPQIVHRFYQLIKDYKMGQSDLELCLKHLLEHDSNKQGWVSKAEKYCPVSEVLLVSRRYNSNEYDITVKIGFEFVIVKECHMGARSMLEIKWIKDVSFKERNPLKIVEQGLLGKNVELYLGEDKSILAELDVNLRS